MKLKLIFLTSMFWSGFTSAQIPGVGNGYTSADIDAMMADSRKAVEEMINSISTSIVK